MVERLPVDVLLHTIFDIIIKYGRQKKICRPTRRVDKSGGKKKTQDQILAIEYKGGKCQICGYNKYPGALDLHHVTGNKNFGIGDRGYTRSWEKIKAELNKCILIYANCHREVEAGITQLPEVIQVEKRGEFGEARKGNPEPSPGFTSGKV